MGMKTTKILFITTLLLAMSLTASAQKVSNIDFDEIKAATTDSVSAYYYPRLLARFQSQNLPLTDKQYTYLYYGSVFAKDYNPYGRNEGVMAFYGYYNKGKYEDAIPYGLEIIERDPLNIRIMQALTICYLEVNDTVNQEKYRDMCLSLIKVIHESGDGKSEATAYVVVKVADEYALLDVLGLKVTYQRLTKSGYTDLLRVKRKVKTPNNEGIKKLYFNVSKLFRE